MTKLTKHAEVLRELQKIAQNAVASKKAEAQDSITGTFDELKSSKVPESTEHTDKNSVGADKLEQGYEQKKSDDHNAPAEHAKAAADAGTKEASTVEEIGEKLLAGIKQATEEAQKSITGSPAELGSAKVPESTEKENKDSVGADKLEQGYEQKKSKEEVAEKAEEKSTEKMAEYRELGQSLAIGLLGALAKSQEKTAADKQAELEKEAGRRDFEAIVTAAADQLYKEKLAADVGVVEEAYASELGKIACDLAVRDEQLKVAVAQRDELRQELDKYASWFENLQQEVLRKEAEEKEFKKQAELKDFIRTTMADQLQSLLSQPVDALSRK